VNTTKASGKIFGSAVGLLGAGFGKNLRPWVVAGAVLLTGTGLLAAFGRPASRSVTAMPTRQLGPAP
jgi:hypothetical protein